MISPSEDRPRTRAAIAGLILAAASVAVLIVPGTASAAKVRCAGQIAPDPAAAGSKTAADYSFVCDHAVIGYSVTFSRQIGIFEPEVLPLRPDGEASGELVSCEGDFPGIGIGCTASSATCPSASSPYTECTGDIDLGNSVTAGFETLKPYCAKTKKGKPKKPSFGAFLVVSTYEINANGRRFINSSQPFRLNNKLGCKRPKPNR